MFLQRSTPFTELFYWVNFEYGNEKHKHVSTTKGF